jgi:hypothetical protein
MVLAYAIRCPWDAPRPGVASWSVSGMASISRRKAVEFCTVYGGKAEGETWASLYKRGYRCVKVSIREVKGGNETKGAEIQRGG